MKERISDVLITAGFLLVKPLSRPAWTDQELLPRVVLSGSECLCAKFPGSYALDWSLDTEDRRMQDFEAVGIDYGMREQARSWATERFGKAFGWENVFYTLETALSAKEKFFCNQSIALLGLALPGEFLMEFLEEAAPLPSKEGFAPVGESGWYEIAKRKERVPEGGQFLGFEPINVENGALVHSWICNGLETHCYEHLGIKPGKFGFIETLSEAKLCCAEISREEVGAEPGLWLPWALTRYA